MAKADLHNNDPQMVTIYDVAREAGVSPSTVSRTYARPGRVRAHTAQHVLEVGERLGYRSKGGIKRIHEERSKCLVLVVADIGNPVFSQISIGFTHAAAKLNYAVLCVDSRENEVIERSSIERVMHLADGIALSASRMSDRTILQLTKSRPILSVNRKVPGIPSITPDPEDALNRTLDLLISLGHQEITYFSGPLASWMNGMRWRLLSDLAKKRKIRVRRIDGVPPTLSGGARGLEQWKKHPTTAIIGYNDLMAIGFMLAAQRSDLKTPEDVTAIGFDNSVFCEITHPGLTSIGASPIEIGKKAAEMLVHQIQHRSEKNSNVLYIPAQLQLRTSHGPARQDPYCFKRKK